MVAALLAFLGTKVGRWLAIAGSAALLVLLVLWRVFAAGGAKARAEAKIHAVETNLSNLKERRDAEADASRRTADERRERVRKYARRD